MPLPILVLLRYFAYQNNKVIKRYLTLTTHTDSLTTPWWKGASIYQIYPRSFCDFNSDGMGDIKGICSKLSYISSLGVDAMWVSPFFPSPMTDFGYDVSEYRNVDPLFGNIDDFKELLSKAHELGIKVIIDQVWSHTSDQHAWFQESRKSRDNEKADWYVWADPKDDGSPPNNWLSLFGGRAWTWDSRRQQYYFHNFLTSQPDLNFHNPLVRQAQLDNGRFWLELGVDGFRLDVVNFYYHNESLIDNPAIAVGAARTLAVSHDNPYGLQQHINDITQPENILFLEQFRSMLNEYEQVTSIGEISDDNPLSVMSNYTSGGNKLHMAYTFDLLSDEFGPEYVRKVIRQIEGSIGDGWPCWAASNHDVVRHNSRWGEGLGEEFAKVTLALLFSMRGSVCLYQGDELGLPQSDVPFESIQDPYGVPFWPEYKGRDGCRTPMPWDGSEGAGFSSEIPWLPLNDEHKRLSVANQEQNKNSVLEFTRRFIRWRKQQPALIHGHIELIEETGEMLYQILAKLKTRNKIILLSSHILHSLTNICDKISYLENKKIRSTYSQSNFPELENKLKEMVNKKIGNQLDNLMETQG